MQCVRWACLTGLVCARGQAVGPGAATATSGRGCEVRIHRGRGFGHHRWLPRSPLDLGVVAVVLELARAVAAIVVVVRITTAGGLLGRLRRRSGCDISPGDLILRCGARTRIRCSSRQRSILRRGRPSGRCRPAATAVAAGSRGRTRWGARGGRLGTRRRRRPRRAALRRRRTGGGVRFGCPFCGVARLGRRCRCRARRCSRTRGWARRQGRRV